MVQVRFKPIIPKGIKVKALIGELESAMKRVQRDIADDFSATTRTWNHKPKFDREFESTKQHIRVAVTTDSDIYRYVSEGTKPHIIRPRRGTTLRFQSGYSAKTSPGAIGSSSGGASGEFIFTRRGVRHPGTKARKFPEAIAKKQERPIRLRIAKAIKQAAKKSGHSI